MKLADLAAKLIARQKNSTSVFGKTDDKLIYASQNFADPTAKMSLGRRILGAGMSAIEQNTISRMGVVGRIIQNQRQGLSFRNALGHNISDIAFGTLSGHLGQMGTLGLAIQAAILKVPQISEKKLEPTQVIPDDLARSLQEMNLKVVANDRLLRQEINSQFRVIGDRLTTNTEKIQKIDRDLNSMSLRQRQLEETLKKDKFLKTQFNAANENYMEPPTPSPGQGGVAYEYVHNRDYVSMMRKFGGPMLSRVASRSATALAKGGMGLGRMAMATPYGRAATIATGAAVGGSLLAWMAYRLLFSSAKADTLPTESHVTKKEGKGDISEINVVDYKISASHNMNLEAKNDLVLKAARIVIDANLIEFKGTIKSDESNPLYNPQNKTQKARDPNAANKQANVSELPNLPADENAPWWKKLWNGVTGQTPNYGGIQGGARRVLDQSRMEMKTTLSQDKAIPSIKTMSNTNMPMNISDAVRTGSLDSPGIFPGTNINNNVSSGGATTNAPSIGFDANTGKVDPKTHYDYLVNSIRGSKLDGFVPADGEKFGIKKGTPEEWARLFHAVAKSESSYNVNEKGPNGEKSYGLYQMTPGEWGLKSMEDVLDPKKNTDAMLRFANKFIPEFGSIQGTGTGPGTYKGFGGMAAYFGPFQTPNAPHVQKQFDWTDNQIKGRNVPGIFGQAGPLINLERVPTKQEIDASILSGNKTFHFDPTQDGAKEALEYIKSKGGNATAYWVGGGSKEFGEKELDLTSNSGIDAIKAKAAELASKGYDSMQVDNLHRLQTPEQMKAVFDAVHEGSGGKLKIVPNGNHGLVSELLKSDPSYKARISYGLGENLAKGTETDIKHAKDITKSGVPFYDIEFGQGKNAVSLQAAKDFAQSGGASGVYWYKHGEGEDGKSGGISGNDNMVYSTRNQYNYGQSAKMLREKAELSNVPGSMTTLANSPDAIATNKLPGNVIYPVTGDIGGARTSQFGYERGRLHAGVDIYARNKDNKLQVGENAPVYSTVDGKIIASRKSHGYGYITDIRGDNGIIYRYAHIAPVVGEDGKTLPVGSQVKQGQVLGHVTGAGTHFDAVVQSQFGGDAQKAVDYFDQNGWPDGMAKPHLHFETRTRANAFGGDSVVDPQRIFGPAMGITGKGERMVSGSSMPIKLTTPEKTNEDIMRELYALKTGKRPVLNTITGKEVEHPDYKAWKQRQDSRPALMHSATISEQSALYDNAIAAAQLQGKITMKPEDIVPKNDPGSTPSPSTEPPAQKEGIEPNTEVATEPKETVSSPTHDPESNDNKKGGPSSDAKAIGWDYDSSGP